MNRIALALATTVAVFAFATTANASADVQFDPLTMRVLKPARVAEQEIPSIPREIIDYAGPYAAGTVVVDTRERRLYLVLDGGIAIRYGIGVARPGFEWAGTHKISQMREWPDWTPPEDMKKRQPGLPDYVPGGLDNPLGARAMYLGSSLYRIHGSNDPRSIGQAMSSGCIRMLNDDVVDLYSRVHVGTPVVVL